MYLPFDQNKYINNLESKEIKEIISISPKGVRNHAIVNDFSELNKNQDISKTEIYYQIAEKYKLSEQMVRHIVNKNRFF